MDAKDGVVSDAADPTRIQLEDVAACCPLAPSRQGAAAAAAARA